jgi:hypothetical protein
MRITLLGVAVAIAATACANLTGDAQRQTGRFVPVAQCQVTRPSSFPMRGFTYGNAAIGVVLWPRGRLRAGPLRGGGSFATVNDDGSIRAKLGWWRISHGRLRISGRRLDAPAPALRADVPDGYGDFGLQVSALTFPEPGCWRITGRLGHSSLAIVVRVLPPRRRA